MESARPHRQSKSATSSSGAGTSAAAAASAAGPDRKRADKSGSNPFLEEVRPTMGPAPPPPGFGARAAAEEAKAIEAAMKSARQVTTLDLEANPVLASKMARAKAAQQATQLAAEATPLKPPGQFAAPPYSSPLTDPQPLSKSTGAAAVAAAMERPFLEPPPILQLSKPLASSRSNDRAAGRAEVRAKQAQDSQVLCVRLNVQLCCLETSKVKKGTTTGGGGIHVIPMTHNQGDPWDCGLRRKRSPSARCRVCAACCRVNKRGRGKD